MFRFRVLIPLMFAVVVIFGTLGCSNAEEANSGGTPPSQTPETIRQQMQKIKDNPNMPQQAKEMALAGLQKALDSRASSTKTGNEMATKAKSASPAPAK